jgi:uncharacterized membrane protein
MRRVFVGAVLVVAYILVGQVVHRIPNPMVPNAIIALNMTVVVIAGVLLGPVAGGLVGLLGTFVNGFYTPAGNPFEQAAVLPHTIMGFAAGLAGRRSVFAGALTVLVGHALNVLVFVSRALMPVAAISGALFFSGLLFEIVVDVVLILFAVPMLRPIMRPASA